MNRERENPDPAHKRCMDTIELTAQALWHLKWWIGAFVIAFILIARFVDRPFDPAVDAVPVPGYTPADRTPSQETRP